MRRKLLACLLVCALLIPRLSFAFGFSPDYLIPDHFVGVINDGLPSLFQMLVEGGLSVSGTGYTEESFTLAQTDANETALYYGSAQGDIEVCFTNGADTAASPQADAPAQRLWFSIFNATDEVKITTALYMFAWGIVTGTNMENASPLMDWMSLRRTGPEAAFALPGGYEIIFLQDKVEQMTLLVLHEDDVAAFCREYDYFDAPAPAAGDDAAEIYPDIPSDFLYADMLIPAINDIMPDVVRAYGKDMTDAQRDDCVRSLALKQTDTENAYIYFDNADWSFEVFFNYGEDLVDTSSPAPIVSFVVAEALDKISFASAITAMAEGLCRLGPEVDRSALLNWLSEYNSGDRVYLQNGYWLTVRCDAEKTQFVAMFSDEPAPAPARKHASIDDVSQEPVSTPIPTPAPTPKSQPEDDERYFFAFDGFTIELKDVVPNSYVNSDATLKFFVTIRNATNRNLNLYVKNCFLNGFALDGTGIVEIKPGAYMDDAYFFLSNYELQGSDKDKAVKAICDPQTAVFTLELIDRDNDYATLKVQPYTLDLGAVPSITPHPTATPMPRYPALTKGDRGDAVAALQRRLIELDYLQDEADGAFGNKTLQALREFCEVNNLSFGDIATSEIQAQLFSSTAKSYIDPYIPLAIVTPSRGEWVKTSGNKMKMRVQVTNVSRHKNVKAFVIYMYAKDKYGNRIYGEDTVYTGTTSRRVKPGETVFCDYIYLPNRSEISEVYARVAKVILEGGDEREPFAQDYAYWDIRW